MCDDSKSEEPYADTDGESDWCPVELPVEAWITDQSYGAGQGDRSHRQKVGIGNQVTNQRCEGAQRC